MGRITVFSLDSCPHCKRAKGALSARKIPFTEINLSTHPQKRNDMLSLTDRLSVPQVFWNEQHIGGADETIAQLTGWDKNTEKSALQRYKDEIESKPDPLDPRLALPTSPAVVEKEPPPRDNENSIALPDGIMTTVLDIMQKLIKVLPRDDLSYKVHVYKDCFVGTKGVSALMEHFEQINTRDEAVAFGRQLQDAKLLHHVCEEHEFKDAKYYYRLQCFHQPDIVNSHRVWTERVDPNAMALLKRLKKLLSKVESSITDEKGLVDYIGARESEHYNVFEEAVCELQGVDMVKMNEEERLVFGINLYNLMIKYAFIKVGIPSSNLTRASFFSGVKFNIGGDVLSFNDLENGVLRSNSKPPYSFSTPFSSSDPRRRLALSRVDCRIHFALNCGAKSCPPVKDFTVESVEEELRIAALSFCEEDENVALDEAKNEIKLTMIMSWYQSDFAESKEKLPESLLRFLRGEKAETLKRMIQSGIPIKVKFHSYDWSTNASQFDVYESGKLKANEFSLTPLLSFDSCRDLME